jgi:hypothetical protein
MMAPMDEFTNFAEKIMESNTNHPNGVVFPLPPAEQARRQKDAAERKAAHDKAMADFDKNMTKILNSLDPAKKKAKQQTQVLFLSFILRIIFAAWLFPYTINTWLVFYEKEPKALWWQGLLIGCIPVLGKYSVLLAIATWIIMYFIK